MAQIDLQVNDNGTLQQQLTRLENLKRKVSELADAEEILNRIRNRNANASASADKRFQTMAASRARIVNRAASEAERLRTGLTQAFGSTGPLVSRLNLEFANFRRSMMSGTTDTMKISKAQERWRTVSGELGKSLKTNNAAVQEGTKQGRGFALALENIGSAAVLTFGPLSGVGSRIIAMAAIMKRIGAATTFTRAGIFTGFALLGTVLVQSTSEAGRFEESILKLDGVLRLAGNRLQSTREDLLSFAREMDAATLGAAADFEAVITRIAVLPDIGEKVLKPTIRIAQDLASLGFGSLSSEAQKLARALADPTQSLRIFREMGIKVDLDLKNLIQTLEATGQKEAAQLLLLQQMQKTVGGSGTAAGGGLSGAIDALRGQWVQLKRVIGEPFVKLATEVVRLLALGLNSAAIGVINLRKNLISLALWVDELSMKFRGTTFFDPQTTKEWIASYRGLDKVQDDLRKMGEIIRGTLLPDDSIPGFDPFEAFESLGKDSLEKMRVQISGIATEFLNLGNELNNFNAIKVVHENTIKFAEDLGLLHHALRVSRDGTISLHSAFQELNDAFLVKNAVSDFAELFENSRTPIEQFNTSLGNLKMNFDRVQQAAGLYTQKIEETKLAIDRLKTVTTLMDGGNIETAKRYQKLLRDLSFYEAGLASTTISQELYNRGLRTMWNELVHSDAEMKIMVDGVERFGDALLDMTGDVNASFSDVREAFSGLVVHIAKEANRLLIVNPLLNALFGTNHPIAGEGGGIFGAIFGGAKTAMTSSPSSATSSSSGWISSALSFLGGLFAEGGISNRPMATKRVHSGAFHNAPRFKMGGLTSGEIPAVLHKNEAVIPLSRGRAVPVELKGMKKDTPVQNITYMTVVTRDAQSFLQNSGAVKASIQAKQSRAHNRNT